MAPRGNLVASQLFCEAGVILALGTLIGCKVKFYSYDSINNNAAIIHVESDPAAIGHFFPDKIGMGTDAPAVALKLTATLAKLENRNWQKGALQLSRLNALLICPVEMPLPELRRIRSISLVCSRPCAMFCRRLRRSRWMPKRCACKPPMR